MNNRNSDDYMDGVASGAGTGIALTAMVMHYVGEWTYIPLLAIGMVLIVLSAMLTHI